MLTCDITNKHHCYNFIFYTSAVRASIKKNMENLPVEILEVVFRPLSKKEDIENCFNANSKWRQIIENMSAKKSILDSFINYKYNSQIYLYFITVCFSIYY